jgi:hypothetical protein
VREASVHTGRTRNTAPAAPGRLGTEHHHRNRRAHLDERVRRGYHPRRGGRYDSGEDRSPSPEPPGLQAFSWAIRRASFPTRFQTPTTITKYSGETRPELWLADYRLAYQLGGTDDDNLIIRNLPLFLSDTARAWLEHLPPGQISNWDDLVRQAHHLRPGRPTRPRAEPREVPVVVDPVTGNVRLTKILMDGGNNLNIIYAETLGLLLIDLSSIRAGTTPFHGIIPEKCVQPLVQLDLPVCFGTPSNFRSETLTFEVVGFRGTYHAVLGRPCYAKFMAVPNYPYLKLKMPGPNGVITVGPTYRHAYKCDMECVEYAEALAESEALIADLESLSKEAPDAKRHAGNFEPAETVKSVPLDPSNDASK